MDRAELCGETLFFGGSTPYAGAAAISTPEPKSVVLGLLAAIGALFLLARSE